MLYEEWTVQRSYARLQVLEAQLHSLFTVLYNPYNKPDTQLRVSVLSTVAILVSEMEEISSSLHLSEAAIMYKETSTNE